MHPCLFIRTCVIEIITSYEIVWRAKVYAHKHTDAHTQTHTRTHKHRACGHVSDSIDYNTQMYNHIDGLLVVIQSVDFTLATSVNQLNSLISTFFAQSIYAK